MKLANTILSVLDTGPRSTRILEGVAKAKGHTAADFQRAIGYLFLKGLILAKGQTSGRRIARNGRRMQAGDIRTDVIIFIILFAVMLLGAVGVHFWTTHLRNEAHEQGRTEALGEVAARDNKALAEAAAKIKQLEEERAAREKQHAAEVAKIDAEGQRRVKDAQATKDRFIADVRAGRIVLRDPGAHNACPDGGGGGAGAPAPGAGVGDGAGAGQLSGAAVEFLLGEAARADQVVERLTACQRILLEDRR
jgi:hypothetical protein